MTSAVVTMTRTVNTVFSEAILWQHPVELFRIASRPSNMERL
jgi:hypothetical protein